MNNNSFKVYNLILINFILLSLNIAPVNAQPVSSQTKVTICPSDPDTTNIPDFNNKNCIQTIAGNINPQNKEIWIKTVIKISEKLTNHTAPIGFFIHGKTSSRVYLNEVFIGANGIPGSSRATETAGLMDAVFYIDKNNIINGYNSLVIKMSAHQGFLELKSPINWLGFDTYKNPTSSALRHYWLSLLPFGAFIVSALYFAILTIRQKDRRSIFFLCAMSVSVASQLMVEVSRGTFAYHYPFQDIRLILILLFSTGFGMSLLSHIIVKFIPKLLIPIISIILIVTISLMVFIEGFDLKSLIGILIPTLSAIGICLYAMIKNRLHATLLASVLILFTVVFFIDASQFLDSNFYYLVACLMLFLFIQQAFAHANEKIIRAQEKSRADQLQLIIDQNHEKNNPATLKVTSVGKVEMIQVNQIAFCKGAGDYVELVMLDNSNILHYGSLKQLEQSLPSLFLKVHRSYIVNTSQIQSLQRNNSGTGQLHLNHDITIPVSRRIMPHVREQLA